MNCWLQNHPFYKGSECNMSTFIEKATMNKYAMYIIGVGTGGSRGVPPPPQYLERGGGNMVLPPPPQCLAPSRENSPQIPWFKPKFCSKSESIRGLCPLDPHKNITHYSCIGVQWPRMAHCTPPILPIFLRLCYLLISKAMAFYLKSWFKCAPYQLIRLFESGYYYSLSSVLGFDLYYWRKDTTCWCWPYRQ